MNKKIITVFFCTLVLLNSHIVAQSKVTKYYAIEILNEKNLKIKTNLPTGSSDSMFSLKDTTVINELKKQIPNINILTDLLNYMSAKHWKLFKISRTPYLWNIYIFKREFDVSELKNENAD